MARGGKDRLVEAAVIVASILVAFAIDAAWDEYQAMLLERDALVAIDRGIQENLDELGSVTSAQSAMETSTRFFLASTDEALGDLSSDSASEVLSNLLNAVTFTPVDGSFSPANLEVLRDPELRGELASWLRLTADVLEDAPFIMQATVDLSSLGASHGAMLQMAARDGLVSEGPPAEVVLQSLRNDPAWVNSLIAWSRIRAMDSRKTSRVLSATEGLREALQEYRR